MIQEIIRNDAKKKASASSSSQFTFNKLAKRNDNSLNTKG
jgi:hypothetical protein